MNTDKLNKVRFKVYSNDRLKKVCFHGKEVFPLYIQVGYDRQTIYFKSYYFDLLSKTQFVFKHITGKKHPVISDVITKEERLFSYIIENHDGYKGQTHEKQGVSFKLGEYKFKGSEIDRNYSYEKLMREFYLVQKHSLIEKKISEPFSLQQKGSINNTENNTIPSNIVSHELSNILEALFKQELIRDNMTYEVSQQPERNKRIRQNQHHKPH
ncbi:MAG: hypothetical protein NVS1B13_06560 [Flavisolibacter sp.]